MCFSFAIFSQKALNLCFEFARAFFTKSLVFEGDILLLFYCINHTNNLKVGYANQNFIYVFAKYLKKCFTGKKSFLKFSVYLCKFNYYRLLQFQFLHCTKKWSFPLRISSVNVTESVENCGFGHIYWKNL